MCVELLFLLWLRLSGSTFLFFTVCMNAFHSHNKPKIWREIQRTSTCHSLDNQTISSVVQMSPGHTFRDCQHSDEPENSWGNTHNQGLPKSMSKWREKTLANVSVSLDAFLQIFLSFHIENWGAVFSQETKPGQQCCRACHIDKVRSTRARNQLQQLTALALWEFTRTNKSSAAEELIIQCYLCWTVGLPIPMASAWIVFWTIPLLMNDFFFNDLSIQGEELDLNSPGCVSQYHHQSWSQAKAASFLLKCQCR